MLYWLISKHFIYTTVYLRWHNKSNTTVMFTFHVLFFSRFLWTKLFHCVFFFFFYFWLKKLVTTSSKLTIFKYFTYNLPLKIVRRWCNLSLFLTSMEKSPSYLTLFPLLMCVPFYVIIFTKLGRAAASFQSVSNIICFYFL